MLQLQLFSKLVHELRRGQSAACGCWVDEHPPYERAEGPAATPAPLQPQTLMPHVLRHASITPVTASVSILTSRQPEAVKLLRRNSSTRGSKWVRGRDQNCLICKLQICEDAQKFTASAHNRQFYLQEISCALNWVFLFTCRWKKWSDICFKLIWRNIKFYFTFPVYFYLLLGKIRRLRQFCDQNTGLVTEEL